MRTRFSMAMARSVGCLARNAAKLEDLGQLAADADRRVQRLAGILIDHRDAFGASAPQRLGVELHHILAVERDGAAGDRAVARQIAHDGERHGGFAAAGFADQPVGLALPDVEAEIAQHGAVAAGDAIGDREVVQFERVFGLCGLVGAELVIERSMNAVGHQVDADHQRGDGERVEQHRPPEAAADHAVIAWRSTGPSRARAAGCRSP